HSEKATKKPALPAAPAQPAVQAAPVTAQTQAVRIQPVARAAVVQTPPDGSLQSFMSMQAEIMSRQLALLEASYGVVPAAVSAPVVQLPIAPAAEATQAAPLAQPTVGASEEKPKKTF